MLQVGFKKWYGTHYVQFSLPWRPRVSTFSASISRFSELKLPGDRCCSQEMGVSPTPCKHGSYPVAPCEASRHRSSPLLESSVKSLLESPVTQLSIDSNFSTFSMAIPRDEGKCLIHQAQPLYWIRLNTSGRSPGIPEGAVSDRLTHCHSSHRHGTHTVGLGIVSQGLLL
jgi:hypothetical protein